MPSLTDIDAQRSIDQTISELEARILQLKTVVLALRTRRNTHSAISKLPTELISSIFVHAQSYAYHWLNVSPVCRQWRAIVLDTPQLWNSINLSWEVQNASEILKRSKFGPLQVFGSYSYSRVNFEPVARAVMSSVERIQELDVSVSHEDSLSLQQLLELNPSGTAPVLETLRLGSSSEAILPRGVFWQDMPTLRVLELRRISVIQLPILPCLSRLILRYIPTLSSSWLLQALLNTPLLQEIDIDGLFPDLGIDIPTPPRVSLPQLTSLRISTDHVLSSEVFDYLDYPCSASVDFEVPPDSDRDPDVSTVSCLQSICFASGDGPALSDSVRIEFLYLHFKVKVSRSRSGAESPPQPRLSISVPDSAAVPSYVELCQTLPLATARTLSLTLTFCSSDAEWFTLFPLCRQLTALRLSGYVIGVLVSLLSTDDNPRPPLETLETIVVCCCNFDGYDVGMVDVITRLLKERQQLGIAIRELRLEQCGISRDVINVFEGLVEVYTDGWESRVRRNYPPVRDEELDDGPEDSAEEGSDQ